MINNYICETCEHLPVCKPNETIAKFHEDAKKPLGVDITINQCNNYSSTDDEE